MEPKPERLFDYREFPVLYVDDERENLRIFELAYRREFSIVTAQSGEEGLEILNSRPVAVVLSDHRMPGMSGVEFLSRVRDLDGRTIRILVTAYGDAATLGHAINDGSIYRYVPKPWDPVELRTCLLRAIEVFALDRERDALVRELGTVNRIAQTINQELALDRLLDLLVEAMVRDLGYDAAALLFFDDAGEQLRFERLRPDDDGVSETLSKLVFTAEEAPRFIGALYRRECPLLSIETAAEQEPAVRAWMMEVAADQILVIPLIGRRGVLGALAVDNRRGGEGFGVADRTLLEGVATQAAIAIQNARLVEDLRQSRRQVLRADRLGTLGTLAAGLAHEINNPLVSIHTFLSLAQQKRLEEDPEFWGDYHRLACREVERIRGLVATMSRLGRADEETISRSPCDIGDLAREVGLLLAREARAAGVSVDVEADARAAKALVSRDQLHQLLLNLLLNAIQASPEGGRVVISVRPDGPARRRSVCVEVTDQGCGISEEDLDRIFDPFFTTKGPDQGTGLGLMICHRIVQAHGGTIEVASRPGQGATFRVRLPASGSEAAES